MKKIALTGVSGSGKDYLAKVLLKKGFTRVSFSDELKTLAHTIYPWMKKDYPPEEKEQPLNITIPETGELITMSPREIWLSLNSLRNVEDGIFIRMLEHKLELLRVDRILISDIRPDIEYNWAVKNGFTIIAIEAEEPVHPNNSFDDSVRKRIEKGMYDYKFVNKFNGTSEFEEFIDEVLNEKSVA